MVNETFGGQSGALYLSKSHIRNMKRNMRKVPIIQIKSELYHSKETSEAEKIISKIDDFSGNEQTNSNLIEKNEYNNKTWFERTVEKIKDLFKNHI